MNNRFFTKVLFIFLIAFLPTQVFSETKTVNVGWYIQSKYQEITDSGTPYGFNYDYLREISEYTDWDFNFILDSFENCVEMLENGTIDILGCIVKTEEREEKFLFPDIALGTTYRYLYTLKDSDLKKSSFKSAENLKIAVLENSVNVGAYYDYAAEENLNEHTLVGCENTYIMEKMLRDKYVDAVISGTLPDLDYYNLIAEFFPQPFYFAVSKERTDILQDMNYALSSLNFENPDYSNELARKYNLISKAVEIFTEDELDVIKSIDTINVAWTPLWAPLQMENKKDDDFSGYIRDIFDEISEISGLNFNYIKCKNTEEAVALMAENKVDIISLYRGNDIVAKQNNLYLTNPIISLPVQIIKKNEQVSNTNNVGVVHSEITYNSISGISSFNLVRYSSVAEALKAVKKEEIQFFITNIYTAQFYLQNYKYSNLYGITLQESPIDLRIAISNTLPQELTSVFNKSIENVPSPTKNGMLIQSSIRSIKNEISNLVDLIAITPTPIILTLLLLILSIIIIISVLLTKKIKDSHMLKSQLFTDNLTGLLSKDGFDWLLRKKLEKQNCDSYTLITFDMEHFEHYNALFGYEAGDELLKNIAKICTKYCPKDELCAHLNSDHFILFVNEKDNSAERRIEQIKHNIQKQYPNYKIFLNFGVYRLSNGIEEPVTMRDYAMLALRTVKSDATKFIGYYDFELHSQLIKESVMSSEMEKALENKEFVAYFQPKYGCYSKHPVGAEALVRWRKDDNTLVPPGEFIPLFEKNGFILKLDMYIFEEACKLLAKQIAEGIKPVPISTNFSRAHMYNHNFAKNLAEIAGKHNIPPFLLEIEITESAFSANQKPLIDLIESLHGYGFLVSIDDFGSGYSSLNLIKELKFDVIKIDQVFFRNSSEVTRTKSVIQCILALAKELGMRTVAEGVETEEQFNFLKDNSCDTIQGFYFSKPLEEKIFTQLLASTDSADI